jgi:SAM-dependent methyltransferase
VQGPAEYRQVSRDRWSRAAAGWAAQAQRMQTWAMPISQWMVDAIRPQPGHTVLELAAGPGDTGLLAAELVQPGGTLICTDFAEPMLEVARQRAAAQGVDNVEFRVVDAESIDLDTASVDAVLCRWGYMLTADPGTALGETRRVLRPGGRVALAAWDDPERNPWMAAGMRVFVARGVMPPPDPTEPGPFAFAAPGRIEGLLEAAGFDEIEVAAVDFAFEADSLDAWWEHMTRTSTRVTRALGTLSPAEHYALRDAVDAAYAPWVAGDGSVRFPARTLVATASA